VPGVPVLVGLFGFAVALGVVGRARSGPAELLTHLDSWVARRRLASRRFRQPVSMAVAFGALRLQAISRQFR
jgi:hypothetical protein